MPVGGTGGERPPAPAGDGALAAAPRRPGPGQIAPGGAGAGEQSEIQVPTAAGIVDSRRLTAILDLNPLRRTSAPGSSDLTERINADGRPGGPGRSGARILAA
jgi:hypothetical protein